MKTLIGSIERFKEEKEVKYAILHAMDEVDKNAMTFFKGMGQDMNVANCINKPYGFIAVKFDGDNNFICHEWLENMEELKDFYKSKFKHMLLNIEKYREVNVKRLFQR